MTLFSIHHGRLKILTDGKWHISFLGIIHSLILHCCNCINVFVSFFVIDYRWLIVFIICNFCYFLLLARYVPIVAKRSI